MSVVTVVCPGCGRPYSVDGRLLGRSGRCKRCGRLFPLSGGGAPGPPSGSVGGSVGDGGEPVSLSPAATVGPPERPSDELPERFGRYRILGKLGEGGMGAVYLAHDDQLDRRVALKVPHFTPRDGPEILERFDREARAAATLDHPNLCPVYDVGQVDGVHYLTMPYIEGKPLSAALGPDRPIPQRQAAAAVRKLALALAEAHRRGVIHRDLKPANIMATRHRELVIMDFGLARRVDRGDAGLTRSGAILGTPCYMAPEQVAGDPAAIGPACDIYGLGAILYELLTGRRPFEGPTALVLARVLVAEPPRPSEHRPGVDPALEAICLKAMAKRPEDRFPTMGDLADALAGYLRSSEVASAGRAGATVSPEAFLASILVQAKEPAPLLADSEIAAGSRRGKLVRSPTPWLPATAAILGGLLLIPFALNWTVPGGPSPAPPAASLPGAGARPAKAGPAVDGRPLAAGAPSQETPPGGRPSVWPARDPIRPGSVWKGHRSYREGGYAGTTVSYELHIRERDGKKFWGHKYDAAPGLNRYEVEGEVNGTDIRWTERVADIVMHIHGHIENDTIELVFDGVYGNGVVTAGDGRLTRASAVAGKGGSR